MEFTVESPGRLDKVLAEFLPQHSRSKLASVIAKGAVLVDGEVGKPALKVQRGQRITLEEVEESAPHDLTPAYIELEVLYEDDHLLVVNKPRGLATHPAASLKEPSLVNALLGRGQKLSAGSEPWRPGIVHRLDKETTGLLVVAKTDAAHVALAQQIEGKTAKRTYLAVVAGNVEKEQFVIDAPLARDPHNRLKMAVASGGKRAVSHVRKLRQGNAGTLLEVQLETGRTHQIRVHLSSLGFPVLGDAIYAPKHLQEGPLQLHAWKLEFLHPQNGEVVSVVADPPEDFLVR